MREYQIRYAKAVDKFFRTHKEIKEQYKEAIRRLFCNDHPESVDVKRINGKRNIYYRIRLGDYRVIYAIEGGKIIVIATLLAGSRGDVYKKMDGLK